MTGPIIKVKWGSPTRPPRRRAYAIKIKIQHTEPHNNIMIQEPHIIYIQYEIYLSI